MKPGFKTIWMALLLTGATACNSQTPNTPSPKIKAEHPLVGGGCDGCEIMYVGMPTNINSVDTSLAWNEAGQKLLLTSKVFQVDGKTPAPNVTIYYWHTDHKGYYSPTSDMDPKARRHGHIRGWVRSARDGSYSVYTIRPAPYPGRDIPAHIHVTVKKLSFNEYYIDELVFDDDPCLPPTKEALWKTVAAAAS